MAMSRSHMKQSVGAILLAAVLGLPASVAAQEECAGHGNQYTRGAEIELSWATRRDDPQTKEERYARALEKLAPAFKGNPDMARPYLLGATANLGLRNYASADSMLARLVQLEPACADHVYEVRFNAWVQLYNRGVGQLQASEEQAALETFDTANLMLEDARSLTNSAAIYHRRGEAAKAVDLYKRALKSGGDDDMIRTASINLAELLRAEGRNDEGLKIYSEYSAGNPEDVLGQLNYAIALMDDGQEEVAQEMFTNLLGRDDLSFRHWSQVGIGLYRTRNFAEAATAFRAAHEMNPFNKETLENLANTYYQSEQYEVLLPLADTLVARYPYETINYNLLANAHRELDDPEAALAVLERREGLTFELLRVQLVAQGESLYSVEGQVLNKSAEAGSQITVPIELLGETGDVVMSDALLLTLPGAGEPSSFQLQLQSQEPVAGFQYGMSGS